jgi:predicted small lipoprotein YifL
MRAKLPVLSACLTLACLLDACGQTGPLYLPDASITTPVEIRPARASSPAADEEKEDEKAKEKSGNSSTGEQPQPAGN